MMNKIRINRKIFIIALSLIVAITLSIYFIEREVKDIVLSINHNIVVEMCENRYKEVKFEFDRTNHTSRIMQELLENDYNLDSSALIALTETLFKLDPKINKFWFGDQHSQIISYPNNKLVRSNSSTSNEISSPHNSLYYKDSLLYYTFCQHLKRSKNSNGRYFGYNIIVPKLHTYMHSNWRPGSSYVIMTDMHGTIFMHPDSLSLGRTITDRHIHSIISDVCDNNTKTYKQGFSDFLQLPVERGYFPILVNDKPMMLIVNIPYLVIEDEVGRFQKYMIIIGSIVIIILAIALITLQQIWKREHSLRQKVEQEAVEIKLQQIINQIDPHFLFNSFNSLYVLIDRNTAEARKFLLSLSKVYRNVLKNGQEPMSTLEGEIEITKEYYFLQKIRFNEKLILNIDIDSNLGSYLIPTMSILIVFENAIKHNSISSDNPLKINIYTKDKMLIIENNYTPKSDSTVESFGIGLDSIRSIYEVHTDSQIVIKQENGLFSCQLPLIK